VTGKTSILRKPQLSPDPVYIHILQSCRRIEAAGAHLVEPSGTLAHPGKVRTRE
jgi:hypothetical protein